jgi:predicted transcriptional regulator
MQPAPTDRELEILKVLWELGQGSVRDVQARLPRTSGLHFNTVQTQLRIMEEKRLVSHVADGRTFIYKPLCTRNQVSSRFLHKVFDGALDQLVLSMLSAEKLDDQELKALEKLIANARKQQQSRKPG